MLVMRNCGTCFGRNLVVICGFFQLGAVTVPAQELAGSAVELVPLTVSASFDGAGWVRADSSITLTLSRSVSAADGRVAILVGMTDVTTLFERTGTTLRYHARALRLPSGENEVVAYTVLSGKWKEIARLPIKVLTPAGFSTAVLKPSVSLNNKGQLAEGHSGTQPTPQPATYQDFGFSGGVQSTHARGAWNLRTQSNFVGASRQQEALRFGIKQNQAPKIDLSDYLLQLERGPATLSLGHVSEGTNRYLINSFASRGVEARVGNTRANLSLAALNGSSVVGWSNFTGLDNSDHRVQSGTLNLELLPSRPGALHVDATLMNGSLLPQTSFTQGAVVDAERSTGEGVQLAAASPAQRLRFAAGLSRSRFANPLKDRELVGDTNVVEVLPETRGALYVEVSAGLLQHFVLPHLFATTLNAVYRRERVDPMYRSVATQTQADRLQDTYELNGNVGVFSLQASQSRNHDNLDDIASILKTLNHSSTAQIAVPMAPLLHVTHGVALFPTVNYGFNRMHQFGAGIPANSDFSASHVPDQQSDVHNAAVSWQIGRWRVQYRYNQSTQDNRQTGRERADFFGVSNTVAVDVTARANLDVGVEGSTEHQTNREAAQTNRVRRAGGTLTWRATPLTTLTAFASSNATRDDPLSRDTYDTETRFELSRGFDLWRTPAGNATRGQLFVRYGKTTGIAWAFPRGSHVDRSARGAWMLTSGVSLRLY
jgi:hypothetical protein